MKLTWLIVGLILVGVTMGAVILGTHANDSRSSFVLQGSQNQFNLNTGFPESPKNAPMYRVIATDSIFEGSPKSMEIKTKIPSEAEAPAFAIRALEKYGGLPTDAVLYKSTAVYRNKYNLTTDTIEEKYPLRTQVIYLQQVNGAPVIGPGAEINIELGENGELLEIEKAWRSLEYAGDVPVISAEEAFEKLNRGELLVKYQSPLNEINISDIKIGYYAEHRNHDQKYYTPVWIFFGTDKGNNSIHLPVSATQ
jgi:hypothetical protein